MREAERNPAGSPYQVGPVKRALTVLSIVGSSSSKLSLAQISLISGIPRSTVFKYLKTLEEDGFVIQDPDTDAFYLGPAVWRLSYISNVHRLFTIAAEPLLKKLRDAHGLTTAWAYLDGHDVVLARVMQGSGAPPRGLAEGTRSPAYASAFGKAILAMLTPEWRRMHLPTPMVALTSATHTDYTALERHLRHAAADGYAVEDGEGDDERWAAAAPVMGHDGVPLVALGVIGERAAATRLDPRARRALITDMRATAEQVSHELGFRAREGRRT